MGNDDPTGEPGHRPVNPSRTLMVQGTGSSTGKSTLVTALCRIFAQDGVDVAPFKAQNMSNNAFVTPDGREIGRSQAEQAAAAGIEPSSDMNPILLKPEGDGRSQVILNGKKLGSREAAAYYRQVGSLWSDVTPAIDRLRAKHELLVMEGAGSPAEVNLRSRDIVNMEVALYCESPVLLIADIDRGGVFASLLGTLELLRPDERALVKGLVINRFRGDMSLLQPLPEMIAARTGVPVLGVVPMITDLQLKEEDGMSVERAAAAAASAWGGDDIKVAVVRLPRISNFDDFDPLVRAGARIRYVTRAADLTGANVIVLPGTKNTIEDLRWARSRGIDRAIAERAREGAFVVGICGGFQMLGERLEDPSGVESSEPATADGLGLLPVTTIFNEAKRTRRVQFQLLSSHAETAAGPALSGAGYEIHTGDTCWNRGADAAPYLSIETDSGQVFQDGARSADSRVFGCYVHGLFDSPAVVTDFLEAVCRQFSLPMPPAQPFSMEEEYDRVADVFRRALDIDRIRSIAGI